jgi:E3 SUMO-protein ligase PIAS1
MRLQLPCRSRLCRHIQCFDATSFLQVQEQAPTWHCPICNKILTFESLAVDEYVKTILRAVPSHVEQVVIDPDGEWSLQSESKPETNGKASTRLFPQDDIVEISDRVVGSGNRDSRLGLKIEPSMRSQTTPSGRPSASSTPATGSKRPIAEVIDLTLSDDDDDIIRPIKRQSTSVRPLHFPSRPVSAQTPQSPFLNHPDSFNQGARVIGIPELNHSPFATPDQFDATEFSHASTSGNNWY